MLGHSFREVFCHAANLFFEARGEHPLGQRWVLDVVRNRVQDSRWPDTYCGVITQPSQFSWYNDLKYTMPHDPLLWEQHIYYLYEDNSIELKAWRMSFLMALDHYFTQSEDITGVSTHYMTVERFIEKGMTPFYNTTPGSIVGKHIFFTKCKRINSCSQY